ncbi:MAG: tRNA (adenosine(37)-N6)-dimethylallyltransferase MiaA [Planctomycetota bacterium]|nr:tRNA (adenosine(37)-N6)-dimethylallyltransferase MiaA [Planctomycetota bacterium]
MPAAKPHTAEPSPETSPEPIWVLTGPTAAGKTDLALRLAESEQLEILSMDSMAVYRRMDIGTAKPSDSARARVPHHLIDLVEPDQDFDTSRWCSAATAAVDEVRSRGRQPLFVGGTPLYLMAFFKGMMEGPAAQPGLRAQLVADEAAEPGVLYRRLAKVDAEAAQRIHQNDHKRQVRALEYFELTGQPISQQRQQFESDGWRVPCRIAAVSRDREELQDRVKVRTSAMLDAGLLEEVASIQDDSGFSNTAAAAIGYAQCLHHLEVGYKDIEELRNMIRRSTHRLIRRQTSWLRRIPEVQWFDPGTSVADLTERFTAGS